MRGVIFNLLEDAVLVAHGAQAWDDLVDRVAVDSAYTSLGSYPYVRDDGTCRNGLCHAELASCWRAALVRPRRHSDDGGALRDFLRTAPFAAQFVMSVNDIIHSEVRKLYAGAGCPHFHFQDDHAGRLVVGYRSPRKLCQLAHGFIEGVSDHYHQHAEIERLACMEHRAALCRMAVRWDL